MISWPIAFLLVGVCLVWAWRGARADEMETAKYIAGMQGPIGVEEAKDALMKEGIVCMLPGHTPRFVEQLGYAVLPRDKYWELLEVVRDAPAEPFDVEQFVADINTWRHVRDEGAE